MPASPLASLKKLCCTIKALRLSAEPPSVLQEALEVLQDISAALQNPHDLLQNLLKGAARPLVPVKISPAVL